MLSEAAAKFSKLFQSFKSDVSIKDLDIIFIDIRNLLLELDIPLQCVQEFLNDIKNQVQSINLKEGKLKNAVLMNLIQDKTIKILSNNNTKFSLSKKQNIIALYGPHGVGKTTTIAKLSELIKSTFKKNVCCVSFDHTRPAAQMQLSKTLKTINVPFIEILGTDFEADIAKIKSTLSDNTCDVLLIDTPGINHNSVNDINFINKINQSFDINHRLLVVDSIVGHSSVNILQSFHKAFGVNGIIITKVDIDHKGGIFFTSQYLINKPIYFVTTGENVGDIEEFNPKRIANIIFGTGDLGYLKSMIEKDLNQDKIKNIVSNILNGGGMNFNDLLQQLSSINNLGGIAKVTAFIPGINKLIDKMSGKMSLFVTKQIAIIHSMTSEERENPDLVLQKSRAERIAKGAGVRIEDVVDIRKRLSFISDTFQKKASKLIKS